MDIEQVLINIKIKLGIINNADEVNEEEDALLEALCKDAYDYMYIFFECGQKGYMNTVPVQLQFVLESVVIKRYRRIGAEGIAIEKIDVLSTTYESGDDFAEYLGIMNHYKRTNSGKNGPKGFRFF